MAETPTFSSPKREIEAPIDLLLSCYLHNEKMTAIMIPQFQHRFTLISHWSLTPGPQIPEIGCGQGDCTIVLAHAVGHSGSVLGIDTAAGSYGSPYTLRQAQEYVKRSELGSRVEFKLETDAATALKGREKGFDAAVLCHSLWYFNSSESIQALFKVLADCHEQLFLAEHSLEASMPEQKPHVLSAETQSLFHRRRVRKGNMYHEPNIRVASSFSEIKTMAKAEGWKIRREELFTPAAGMRDGFWEVVYVLGDIFWDEVVREELEEAEKGVWESVQKVRAAVEEIGGVEKVKGMDVWWAVLDRT